MKFYVTLTQSSNTADIDHQRGVIMDCISVSSAILGLIEYAVRKNLLEPADKLWAANSILYVLHLEGLAFPAVPAIIPLEKLLDILLEDAVTRGILRNTEAAREALGTAVMGCITPQPSAVIRMFKAHYNRSPEEATHWLYTFCRDCDYISTYRTQKDIKWTYQSRYGDIALTINMAKPEKDPLDIAAAAHLAQAGYPACQLCRENEGYAGRVDHPARQNLRIIPLEICGEEWGFQYSPYVYYNEHCIVLNMRHTPMVIDKTCFSKLFAFLDLFPHYFVGSNADLPIVGGSILSHEHFQGGRYVFPIERAAVRETLAYSAFPSVSCAFLDWPLSTLRLCSADHNMLIGLADKILRIWKGYDDPEAGILSSTNGVLHNTVTPIARRRGSNYELDLVLRNNRTTAEYPTGLFHPHIELHHIKKENIGLIEVMGLAILPPHLKKELETLGRAMLSGSDLRAPDIARHADWAADILYRRSVAPENINDVLQEEIGAAFVKGLEQAGVFGQGKAALAAFHRFSKALLPLLV